jgi:hypothetical protein
MTFRTRLVIDLADRARLPWRFHARRARAGLGG